VVPDAEFSDRTITALEKSRAIFSLPVTYICPQNANVPTHLGYNIINLDIDYRDYSQWMLQELHKYVESDHILTIQYDSCVINAKFWDDEYFEYDYIGAVWPNNWNNRVGNGGHSLRGYKFMKETSKLIYNKTGNKILDGEDYFACVTNYGALCDQGIKFAPVNLARKFCVEHPIPEKWHDYDDLSTYESFAFHGEFNTAGMRFINKQANECEL
jgi:hypothetical protein